MPKVILGEKVKHPHTKKILRPEQYALVNTSNFHRTVVYPFADISKHPYLD